MKPSFLLLLAFFCLPAPAGDAQPPKLEEVVAIIRTHLPGVTSEELEKAAASGIDGLAPRVRWVAEPPERPPFEEKNQSALFDGKYGHFRIGALDAGLPAALAKTVAQWRAAPGIQGLILDLRYAFGEGWESYDAAAGVASLFVREGEPLFKLGDRRIQAAATAARIELPVAVLVNSRTEGAAEVLAGVLREAGAGLIIGSRTAGEAGLFETFTLSTGQRLRITRSALEMGQGPTAAPASTGPASSPAGLVPDIEVAVDPDEKVAYLDPYRVSSPQTNVVVAGGLGRARRVTEADLVRRHRGAREEEGLAESGGTPRAGAAAVVTDPVLARGLDFLKGISVLQQQRPP